MMMTGRMGDRYFREARVYKRVIVVVFLLCLYVLCIDIWYEIKDDGHDRYTIYHIAHLHRYVLISCIYMHTLWILFTYMFNYYSITRTILHQVTILTRESGISRYLRLNGFYSRAFGINEVVDLLKYVSYGIMIPCVVFV